ncbi:MAG: hypothetical protein GY851_09250 [bacterium]|nr:hypothetical protein [bacterium]
MEAFLRPIEITTANDGITVDGNAKTMTNGVYASILTFISELEDVIQTEFATVTIRLTTDGKIKFIKSDAGNAALTAIEYPLMRLLGEDDDTNAITVPASSSITMDLTPEYCWFPTYQEAKGHPWDVRYAERFAGSVAQSGALSGLRTGAELEYREFEYNFEPIANVLHSGEDECYTMDGTTYYPNQRRSFTTFIDEARSAYPTVSTNTISVGGCWYVPNFENYCGDSPTWAHPDAMSSYNGTVYLHSCTPHRYTFCNLDPKGADKPKHSINENHTDFWSVNFGLHTTTPPTWTAP